MDKIENPGTSADTHGGSSRVSKNGHLIEAPYNTGEDDLVQEVRPATRTELIRYGSNVCLAPGPEGIAAYDGVPDQARTDEAIGCLAVRERVFLTLVCLSESLNGDWHFDVKQGVEDRFSSLMREFGDDMNTDLVEQLFTETLVNEWALDYFLAGAVWGRDNV